MRKWGRFTCSCFCLLIGSSAWSFFPSGELVTVTWPTMECQMHLLQENARAWFNVNFMDKCLHIFFKQTTEKSYQLFFRSPIELGYFCFQAKKKIVNIDIFFLWWRTGFACTLVPESWRTSSADNRLSPMSRLHIWDVMVVRFGWNHSDNQNKQFWAKLC